LTWAQAHGVRVLDVSLVAVDGFAPLRALLQSVVVDALSGADFPAATRERHRRDLTAAHGHLQRAIQALAPPVEVELAAEDVRLAARNLARISGRIDAEDVLDRVFARFCIGK
jgi:tRNA modification GTPase